MFEALLKEQVRNDPTIAGMLAKYNSRPAFFYQNAPADIDRGWGGGSTYPRADYVVDMTYDPERKAGGTLTINVWCSSQGPHMPEDIEKRLVGLISGTFYTNAAETICAAWGRSDPFTVESRANGNLNNEPQMFGVTVTFDLLLFPTQDTTDPDPIQGLNEWISTHFPDVTLIGSCHDKDSIPGAQVWKPDDQRPALYWRFVGADANDRQSYAVN